MSVNARAFMVAIPCPLEFWEREIGNLNASIKRCGGEGTCAEQFTLAKREISAPRRLKPKIAVLISSHVFLRDKRLEEFDHFA